MAASRRVRIYGSQRSELDVDVMVQVLILLGQELEQRTHQERSTQGGQKDEKTREVSGKGTLDADGGRS